jgi:hypothetical protein
LGPRDDLTLYQWHQEQDGTVELDRRDNGDCVYLTDAGCGIHGHAPDICRRMDCRELFLRTDEKQRAMRVAQNPQMALIYRAAMERLHTLKG